MDLLTTRQVSDLTGISETTLRYWRHADQGPASFKLGGRKVVYKRSEVSRWLAAQEAATVRGGSGAA